MMPASYMEVKDAGLHSIRWLTVGQEGVMVEDTAYCPVGGGWFGLGCQGWGIWIYGLVQVSDQGKQGKISAITL